MLTGRSDPIAAVSLNLLILAHPKNLWADRFLRRRLGESQKRSIYGMSRKRDELMRHSHELSGCRRRPKRNEPPCSASEAAHRFVGWLLGSTASPAVGKKGEELGGNIRSLNCATEQHGISEHELSAMSMGFGVVSRRDLNLVPKFPR